MRMEFDFIHGTLQPENIDEVGMYMYRQIVGPRIYGENLVSSYFQLVLDWCKRS